jgi:hypothetical protein
VVHHLHRVQVLPVHPVRIAMAHLQVVAPQVVVTHQIAALTQVVARRVDRQIDAMVLAIHHVEIHPVQVRVHLPIAANVALRVDRQIDAMLVHQLGVQMNAGPPVHATHVQVQIVQPAVRMAIEIHVRRPAHLQIVPIVRHVRTVIDQNVAMTVVHQVIVQRVVRMAIEIHDHHQIVPIAHPVLTVIAIPDLRHVQVPIEENAVTVQEIHDQVLIVEIVVQVLIVEIVVQVRIDQQVAHTETAIHAHLHVQLQTDHVAKTLMVEIVHALAMTATPVHLRVTVNAAVVPIVPVVVSPMIVKNVHAVVLAKSA